MTETRRALIWGAGVPMLALLLGLLHPAGLLIRLAWPLQVLRLSRRMGWEAALFTVLGKLPEAQGALGYHLNRLRGRQRGLIEYK